MVRALYNFVATNDNEISFKEYDLMSVIKKVDICITRFAMLTSLQQGGRMDGEWETDFEDLGLSKKEREKKKREQEKREREEFPAEGERFYWWKASLTRRAKDGTGTHS